MSNVRIHAFGISLDGYGAGLNEGLEHGLGVGGEVLHDWVVHAASFDKTHGKKGEEKVEAAIFLLEATSILERACAEHLWQGLEVLELGYRRGEYVTAPAATHLVFTKAWGGCRCEN